MPGVIVKIDPQQIEDASIAPAKLADLPGLATALTPHLDLGGGGPHTHPQSDVVSLVSDLAGKAASGHDHAGVYATAGHNHDATYAPIAHVHSGIPSAVHKTADQTFTSATPANVSDLSFPVVANRHYFAEFIVAWRSNTATVGVGLSVTIPAAATFAGWVESIIAADGAGGGMQGAITASDDAVLITAAAAINTDYVAIVKVVLVPSANGTLQMRGRTETGTTPVIIRKGSFGLLYDRGA